MRNCPLCFVFCSSGSARVPRADDRVSRSWTFPDRCRNRKLVQRKRIVSARRRNQHARRVRSQIHCVILFLLTPIVCFAEDARSTSADGDQLPESESVVVSATRFEIP